MPAIRTTLITLTGAVVVAAGIGGVAVATDHGSAITQPRLERSVTTSFSNVYAQEAALLGHKGVTPSSMAAKTYCDKGPGIAQSGPGTSWNCLVSWHDPSVPMPSSGYGKLELTVHTNGCYTAGSPSSLVGYQTITDADGKTVSNPAYEFDGCIDPDGDNAPTGVAFPPELKVTSTTAEVDARQHVGVDLACGPGANGCRGTVTATSGGRTLGSASYAMTEQATDHLSFPRPLPADAKDVTYTVRGTKEVLPSPADLPVQK